MSGVNKVILIGRLGEPKHSIYPRWSARSQLRMATMRWTDRDGQRQERTEWHSVTVWGKQQSFGQCRRVVRFISRVDCKPVSTDREGINRKAVDIVANQIVFWAGDQKAAAVAAAVAGSSSGGNQGGGGGWGQSSGGSQGGGGGWGRSSGGNQGGGGGWSVSGGNQGGGGGWGQSGGNQTTLRQRWRQRW